MSQSQQEGAQHSVPAMLMHQVLLQRSRLPLCKNLPLTLSQPLVVYLWLIISIVPSPCAITSLNTTTHGASDIAIGAHLH